MNIRFVNSSGFVITWAALTFGLVACVCASPQEPVPSNEPTTEAVSIKGMVVTQKKYSFVLDTGTKQFQVKPVPNAKIALLMKKPFFDWKSNKVGVEVNSKDSDSSGGAETKQPRTQYDIPSKTPFVISEFRSIEHLEKWQASKDKRLNFYVVQSSKVSLHDPTNDKPFLAAKIIPVKNNLVKLETDEKTYRVRLGFHTATMSGFSVADLKPQKTRVTLSGVIDKKTGVISASNIIFEPIAK